jgi:tRNA (guanosine-2'-O-)-methyltransferase
MNIPPTLIENLSQMVLPERLATFHRVLTWRTRYITIALEDIYQSQNASAVLRTCDCFGIQDVHIIEKRNKYDVNPDVALGSDQWLNLIKYNSTGNNTIEAIAALKSKGYRIVATGPHTNDVDLPDFDVTKGPFALFFGTELMGLSPHVFEYADEFVKIPMFGFAESFNISVSAAIFLQHLVPKLHQSSVDWKLTQTEQNDVMLKWLKNSVRRSDLVVKRICKESGVDWRPFL